jgi:hypothetical protein
MGAALVVLIGPCVLAEESNFNANELEFFERRIRPILVNRCFECHGPNSERAGGLLVDTREHLLAGGSRGPAIDPADPAKSLLLSAVRGEVAELKMPPTGAPLGRQEIDSLQQWLSSGIAFPAAPLGPIRVDELWSAQPITERPVPTHVGLASHWAESPIDRFVLASLQSADLSPSRRADKYQLLRRVTFDLVGLPPTKAEIDAFVADNSADAYERVVERLLASPHYGERWARHWLDVVRYGDTNGVDHEMVKPYAYRYRDYVVDAFNQDLPIDQFLREQIAGDLQATKRMSADESHEVSSLGSAFWWLGEFVVLPFDVPTAKQVLSEQVENQIDVFGKALLGLTLSCARCHDHKFDPIPTVDYYGLAGIMRSTTNVVRCLDTPQRQQEIEAARQQIESIEVDKSNLLTNSSAKSAIDAARVNESHRVAEYMLAARQIVAATAPENLDEQLRVSIRETASSRDLSPTRLTRWVTELRKAGDRRDPLLYPWFRFVKCAPEAFASRKRSRLAEFDAWNDQRIRPQQAWNDFEGNDYGDWISVGSAFGDGPSAFSSLQWKGLPESFGQGAASSWRFADALTGRLVGPRFRINDRPRYLCFWIAGGNEPGKTCVNLILNGQAQPLGTFWTATGERSHRFRLVAFDLQLLRDREAYVEVIDDSQGEWGHIVVDSFFFTDQLPPADTVWTNRQVVERLRAATSLDEFAQLYEDLVVTVVAGQQPASMNSDETVAWEEVKRWVFRDDSLVLSTPEAIALLEQDAQSDMAALNARCRELAAQFPETTLALVSADLAPHDAMLERRGDPNDSGPIVPRHFLSLIADDAAPPSLTGSGRLELADWLLGPHNPLTARVFVNRVWAHFFGRGLVNSVDNFGSQGEKPTHPELLDYLARQFVESGWSLKALHRRLVLSSSYQQTSHAKDNATSADPDNLMLHCAAVRRLDAECIRDAMLQLSGNLSQSVGGPPILIASESSDPPAVSTTPERRSVYLEVRRNDAVPLLEAFGFPRLSETVGQRATSITPGQALVMLNNPFVLQQAAGWATRLLSVEPDARRRIQAMIIEGLGRPPRDDTEIETIAEFVRMQQQHYSRESTAADAERLAWRDACHTLFNLGEFVFLQ